MLSIQPSLGPGGPAFRGVTGTAGAHLPPPVLMAFSWRKQLHPTRTGRRRSARSSPSPVWLYLFNLALARVCVCRGGGGVLQCGPTRYRVFKGAICDIQARKGRT